MTVDVVVQGRDQATSVLEAVSAKIQSMQGTTITANAATVESFKDTRQEIRLNSSAVRTLGMAYRQEIQPVFSFATALNATGQIFSRITNAYQAYNVMQIREQQALGGVTQAQQNYNQAVQQFGPSSQQAINAGKQLQSQQQQYEQTVQQNKVATVELGFQLGTQLPLAIMNAAIQWGIYQTVASKTAGTNATLTSTLGNLFSGVVATAGGLGTLGLVVGTAVVGTGLIIVANEKWSQTQRDLGTTANLTAREVDLLGFTTRKTGLSMEEQLNGIRAGKISIASYGTEFANLEVKIRSTTTVIGSASMSMAEYSKKYYDAIEGMHKYPPTFEIPPQEDLVLTVVYHAEVEHPVIPAIPPQEYDIWGNPIVPYIPQPPDQYYNIWGILHEVSKTIFGFQHGTPYVPETGLAMVHKGERIIPASQNTMSSHTTMYNTFNRNMDMDLFLDKWEQRQVSAYRKIGG